MTYQRGVQIKHGGGLYTVKDGMYAPLSIPGGIIVVFGFSSYMQLELLAFEDLVPWISICVCTGVT